MSRIGKKPIEIPGGVEVKFVKGKVEVKGPKGTLVKKIKGVKVEAKEGKIFLTPFRDIKNSAALWGLGRALVSSMLKGVEEGFEKKLEIQGVGYRAEVKDKKMILHLGFTNPIEFKTPEGIDFKVEKNIITVSGIDKQLVGNTAARIRSLRKPEPYKGKGIRYEGEVIKLKVGKKAVAGE